MFSWVLLTFAKRTKLIQTKTVLKTPYPCFTKRKKMKSWVNPAFSKRYIFAIVQHYRLRFSHLKHQICSIATMTLSYGAKAIYVIKIYWFLWSKETSMQISMPPDNTNLKEIFLTANYPSKVMQRHILIMFVVYSLWRSKSSYHFNKWIGVNKLSIHFLWY